jgi:hypothetical protein
MNIHDITRQIRAFADELDAVKAPTPLPIQPLAADQVTATPTMQNAASRVLEEEPEESDPYAELKAAHAAGKVIQAMCLKGEWKDMHYSPLWNLSLSKYRIKPDEIPWIEWHGGECPLRDDEVEILEYKLADRGRASQDSKPSELRWPHAGSPGDITAYRVLKARTPTPKQPLGPEDVPPFSLIRRKPEQNHGQQWHWRTVSYVHGIGIQCGDRGYKWEDLQKDYEINRPRHRDADGNPTLWEACER